MPKMPSEPSSTIDVALQPRREIIWEDEPKRVLGFDPDIHIGRETVCSFDGVGPSHVGHLQTKAQEAF